MASASATMAPADSAAAAKKSRRKFITTIIVVSVVVHLLFGGVAGVWVVAKYLTRPPAVFEVKKTKIPPKKPQHQLEMEKVDSMAPAPTFNHKIQSLRPSKLALPDLPKIDVASPIAFDPKAMITAGTEGLVGMGAGAGTGFVFGTKISATRLGVLLDVSFSTHDTLHAAVEEIKKSFPNAIIVLVPGTGMTAKKGEGEVMTAEEFEKKRKRLPHKGNYNANTFLFEGVRSKGGKLVPSLLKSNSKFKKLYEDGKKENRLFTIYIPPNGAVNRVTQDGFYFLMKQGVDGIYWFADFADPIDAKSAAPVIRELKKNGVKVYQQILPSKKKIEPIKLSFAKQTGGEVITKMK